MQETQERVVAGFWAELEMVHGINNPLVNETRAWVEETLGRGGATVVKRAGLLWLGMGVPVLGRQEIHALPQEGKELFGAVETAWKRLDSGNHKKASLFLEDRKQRKARRDQLAVEVGIRARSHLAGIPWLDLRELTSWSIGPSSPFMGPGNVPTLATAICRAKEHGGWAQIPGITAGELKLAGKLLKQYEIRACL